MNCEKCKNKKATVFYADDGGGQHALCAPCAQSLGKLARHSAPVQEDVVTPGFTPSSCLFSLCDDGNDILPLPCVSSPDSRGDAKCPFCASTLDTIIRTGRAGCPDCYTVFGESLFCSALNTESAAGARMPRRKRASLERRRNIATLKHRMRIAVEAEDFELAATLRDEIKKLEIQVVGG